MSKTFDKKPDHLIGVKSKNNKSTDWLDQAIISIGHVISFFFLISSIIIVWEIISRYVFDAPTFWVHETTVLICALLFAYGGSYCIARNKHIRIVLLYNTVSPAVRRWLDVLISVLCVIYASGLVWAGWFIVRKSFFTPQGAFHMETSGSAWDPPFPAVTKMFLFLVLLVMLIQFVLHVIANLRGSRHNA